MIKQNEKQTEGKKKEATTIRGPEMGTETTEQYVIRQEVPKVGESSLSTKSGLIDDK